MAERSEKQSAINGFFLFFLVGAILFGAYSGKMKEVNDASFQAAKDAVTLAIGLVGIMAFWLGMMRVLEAGGLMYTIARLLRPVMVRLFPDVPAEHPAMGAMILNISANMLGLGNAATPFGIRAMTELNRLNPIPGTATNAMCLFLAINTSSVTILPLGVIGARAVAGSVDPAAIFLPTLLATTCSTAVGIIVAILLAGRDTNYIAVAKRAEENLATKVGDSTSGVELPKAVNESFEHLRLTPNRTRSMIGFGAVLALFLFATLKLVAHPHPGELVGGEFASYWLLPLLILLIVWYGLARGVKIYEAVTEGAKQGFDTAVRIIPFLVVILVSIAMFRASGAMDLLASWLSPFTSAIGVPVQSLPMALVRPLSGSGAFGVMNDILKQDPNSFDSYVVSTMMGAADTTFYIIAVYFGAVGVTKVRHAVVAGIAADIAGMLAACWFCRLLWNGPL